MPHRLDIRRNGTIIIDAASEKSRALDRRDPAAILEHLGSAVELEADLSAAQLMRALSPWSKALSRLGRFDFDGWAAAMTKSSASLVTDGHDADGPPFEAVVLFPTIHTDTSQGGLQELRVSWDNIGRLVRPDAHGHRYNGIDYTPPHQWAHLPLIIECRAQISEDERRVFPTEWQYYLLLGPAPIEVTPTLYGTIIVGFFGEISFHGDPEATRRLWEALRDGRAFD